MGPRHVDLLRQVPLPVLEVVDPLGVGRVDLCLLGRHLLLDQVLHLQLELVGPVLLLLPLLLDLLGLGELAFERGDVIFGPGELRLEQTRFRRPDGLVDRGVEERIRVGGFGEELVDVEESRLGRLRPSGEGVDLGLVGCIAVR